MRVLIVEPHLSGHHVTYLRWLLEATERRGWEAIVATVRSREEALPLQHVLTGLDHVEMRFMDGAHPPRLSAGGSARLLARDFRYWDLFRRSTRTIRKTGRVDAVVLPYLDYCFYSACMLGSPFGGLPWCAISMRLSASNVDGDGSGSMPWKWRMAMRLLRDRSLRRLFVINPSVAELPSSWTAPALRSKLAYLADPAALKPADTREIVRTRLGLPAETVLVLAFGAIDERKGLDALIERIATDAGLARVAVLVAGKLSDGIRRYLQSSAPLALQAGGRLFVMDRFLSEDELADAFAGADAVWVGYRNHAYMSGVLVLAGMAGLPVVGTNVGEVGRLIARHRTGVCIDIDRKAELSGALRQMLDPAARVAMGTRARRLFAGHTVENFGNRVLEALAAP